jgi:hypothetical protein
VALAAIGRDLPDALLTFTEGLTIGLRQRIGSFALASRISEVREFAEAGGLATYGASRAPVATLCRLCRQDRKRFLRPRV